jgi:hypothetical protein
VTSCRGFTLVYKRAFLRRTLTRSDLGWRSAFRSAATRQQGLALTRSICFFSFCSSSASCEKSLTGDNGLSDPLFRLDPVNCGIVRDYCRVHRDRQSDTRCSDLDDVVGSHAPTMARHFDCMSTEYWKERIQKRRRYPIRARLGRSALPARSAALRDTRAPPTASLTTSRHQPSEIFL